MNTGTLYVFHNTRNQNILAITYRINLNLFTHKVLINKNWMFLHMAVDN